MRLHRDTYRYHTVSICYDTFYNGLESTYYIQLDIDYIMIKYVYQYVFIVNIIVGIINHGKLTINAIKSILFDI